jgi:patatin-like phospholipase/acyl hydrolase
VEISLTEQKDAKELAVKRILTLDGGGIRGVFSLEILLRMQTMLRVHYGNDKLVLSDHFDMFAGTSTGAIIATALCWGMDVESILNLYVEFGRTMFTPVPWYKPVHKLLVSKFEAKPLSDFLRKIFSEDGNGEVPALLDSPRLRKALLVVVRNHTTGSAWPLTNNPKAMFNDVTRDDCNMKIPLWKVVRASTAAPVYFDPEEIELGGRKSLFVDGAVTPYNNPALIAAMSAILPCYNMNWPSGPENVRLVSVGTMTFSSALPENIKNLWVGFNAAKIPAALMQAAAWQQDFLCRCMGECLYGEALDREVGTMMEMPLPGERWWSYVRYNASYREEKAKEMLLKYPKISALDAVHSIPMLQEVGKEYADEHVRVEHLL